jgi:hypothetical protein
VSECAYPGCENEAELKCAVCGKAFCAFHTYERYYHTQRYYFCKLHYQPDDQPLPSDSGNVVNQVLDRVWAVIKRLAGG